jgi:hypothetical protein
MSKAGITGKNLGAAKREKLIAERLAQELKDYPEWRVTVLGSANTEILEIKVDGPSGKWFGVRKRDQNNTVERVVEEAMNMIYTEGREGKNEERIKTVSPTTHWVPFTEC